MNTTATSTMRAAIARVSHPSMSHNYARQRAIISDTLNTLPSVLTHKETAARLLLAQSIRHNDLPVHTYLAMARDALR